MTDQTTWQSTSRAPFIIYRMNSAGIQVTEDPVLVPNGLLSEVIEALNAYTWIEPPFLTAMLHKVELYGQSTPAILAIGLRHTTVEEKGLIETDVETVRAERAALSEEES